MASPLAPLLRLAAADLKVPAASLAHADLIQEREGRALVRLQWAGCRAVLKWSAGDAGVREVRAYRLLEDLGVPTLPVLRLGERAVLVEDLEAPGAWRPATPVDLNDPAVGSALSAWYRKLHAAGERLMARPGGPPPHLTREIDALTPERAAGLAAHPACADAQAALALLADHVARLAAAFRALPETLNFSDLYWGNVALSREAPIEAIVYDYHLLGIGPRAADVRNVCGSLGAPARAAFVGTYGPVDPREVALDAPLASGYALWVALQRPQLPAWAEPLLAEARDGTLEHMLHRAIAAM